MYHLMYHLKKRIPSLCCPDCGDLEFDLDLDLVGATRKSNINKKTGRRGKEEGRGES